MSWVLSAAERTTLKALATAAIPPGRLLPGAGEGTLDKVVSTAPNAAQSNNIEFSQARADFIRAPGRMTVKDGVLRGPIIGATVEGSIDYLRDQVSMRGTLVPLYGLNNMFGQIPIVGLFLGGG